MSTPTAGWRLPSETLDQMEDRAAAIAKEFFPAEPEWRKKLEERILATLRLTRAACYGEYVSIAYDLKEEIERGATVEPGLAPFEVIRRILVRNLPNLKRRTG